MDDSKPAAVGGEATAAAAVVPMEVDRNCAAAEAAQDKRKRGRPPRGQAAPAKPVVPRKPMEEENVCFICFDGGSLVLCDRKGCPKAYHPACIKRDESYFSSKAKWNCGWHICSVCQKASHYLCYTCTFSLCKGCTGLADYSYVKGNKGFCSTCMKTILLIENKDEANKDKVQVDFDDKTTWEYLFKVYWIDLKEKLGLTLKDLIQAKRPRNEASVGSVIGGPVDLAKVRCEFQTSMASPPPEEKISAENSETEKLWYYRDPSSKLQGPFTMVQLREWNKGGFFPPDFKVWKNDELQAVSLTDALHQQFNKANQILGNVVTQSLGLGAVSENKVTQSSGLGAVSENKGSFGLHESSIGSVSESKQTKLLQQGVEMPCLNVNTQNVRMQESGTNSFLDLLKGNKPLPDKCHEHSPNHLPSDSSCIQMQVGLPQPEKGFEGGGFHSITGNGNQNSCGGSAFQGAFVQEYEMKSNSKSHSVQSSGQNWESLPITNPKPLHPSPHFASITKATDLPEHNGRMSFTALLNHNPKESGKSWEVQAAEELLSLSSSFPIQRPDIRSLPSPSPSGEDQCGQTTETKEHSPSNVPVQDSGRSWSSASSLVINEWDSGLVSNPPVKQPEPVVDHAATPTSNTHHLINSSPSHLASTISGWQPIEFTTLDEESVSDLLAEVECLESQSGLGSPASAMRCGKEAMPRCKNEYFNFFEELPDPAKSGTFSSLHCDR